jgi:hypothetical protein
MILRAQILHMMCEEPIDAAAREHRFEISKP